MKVKILATMLLMSLISASAMAIPARFLQVTGNIFRGARPTLIDLTDMQSDLKIATDIDLENNDSVSTQENSYAEALGMKFLLTAMHSLLAPTDAEVNGVLAQLQDAANFPIYLHCQHGEDRTGLMIGLYRVEVQGWTPAAAYQEMLDNGFHPVLFELDNYFRKRTGLKRD